MTLLPTVRRIRNAFALGLFAFFALGVLVLQSPAPVAAQTLSVGSLLQSDGTLNLETAADGALDVRDWNVRLDPHCGPVLSKINAAPSADDTWSELEDSGLNGDVYTLAVWNNALYVGGDFTSSSGSAFILNHIAKYDGST